MTAMRLLAAVTSIALAASSPAGTTPLGSSFSYQGALSSGGTPYNGAADFQFTLWEESAAGAQVGAMIPANAVLVTEGVFSTPLDFGVLAFDGNERWLEISVRTPAGGAGAFTTLTPRQRIGAVPYALHSLNALIAGTQGNAVTFTNVGNTYSGSSMSLDGGTLHVDAINNRVGIGTTTPAAGAALDVQGGSVRNTPTVNYGGFHLMQGANIAGFLGLEGNNVYLSNNIGGSLNFSTWPGSNAVTERMRIYPSGRIRMGPTNAAPEPTSWVHIIAGFAGVPMNGNSSLSLERNAANYLNILAPNASETGILFGKPTGGAEAGGIIYNNAGTPDGLQFRTNGNVNRMVISSEGNVGIGGITVPAARLDVFNGQDTSIFNTAIFRTATPGSNYSQVHSGPNGDWYIRSAANAGKVIIQDTGGPVGIGTSAPVDTLTVAGPIPGAGSGISATDLSVRARLWASGAEGRGYLGTTTGHPFFFRTNNLDRMKIEIGGQVLVSSPQSGSALLRLYNPIDNIAGVLLDNGFRQWLVGQNRPPDNTLATDVFFIHDQNAGVTRLMIDLAGNVGIGTTLPAQKLSVNGSAGKTDGPSWSIYSDARLKTGIRDLPPGSLDRLLRLRGREFQYTDAAVRDNLGMPGEQIGFIAQEVEGVLPEWIDQTPNGYLSLTERGTTALMVEALRELRAERDSQIDSLRTDNDELRAEVADLRALVNQILQEKDR